jgi:hypothetical protein
VKTLDDVKRNLVEATKLAREFEGTPSNPIIIDEDTMEKENT